MMQPYSRAAQLILIVCVVCGCSTGSVSELHHGAHMADGTVGAEPIPAPTDARYQATPGVDYVHGTASEGNAMPVYPVELLKAKLPPTQVIVRLVVDEDGAVRQASVIEDPSALPAFIDATLAAVRGWTFLPLRRIESGEATRVPFTQDYRFTYRQRDGRGSVESVTP